MKSIILAFLCVVLLSSCDNARVPDDANVYVVDSSAVYNGDYLQLNLRDLDEPVMVPLADCDDIFYPKGTIVVINEDFEVSRINQERPLCISISAALFIFLIALVVLKEKKMPQ